MDAALKEIVEKAKTQYGQIELKNIKGRFYLYKVTSKYDPQKKETRKISGRIYRQSNSTRHHPSQNPRKKHPRIRKRQTPKDPPRRHHRKPTHPLPRRMARNNSSLNSPNNQKRTHKIRQGSMGKTLPLPGNRRITLAKHPIRKTQKHRR